MCRYHYRHGKHHYWTDRGTHVHTYSSCIYVHAQLCTAMATSVGEQDVPSKPHDVGCHAPLATTEAGTVATEMEQRKRMKYAHLDTRHFFVALAVETLRAMGPEVGQLFHDLSRRIACATSDPYLPPTASVSGSPMWQCSSHFGTTEKFQ